MRIYTNNQQGYIALIAVVIIVAATLAISLSLNVLSIGETQSGLIKQQSVQTFGIADACMQEAYIQLERDSGYSGASLNIGGGSCTIIVTDVGTDLLVVATGTLQNIQRKLESLVTVNDHHVTVHYWEELTE